MSVLSLLVSLLAPGARAAPPERRCVALEDPELVECTVREAGLADPLAWLRSCAVEAELAHPSRPLRAFLRSCDAPTWQLGVLDEGARTAVFLERRQDVHDARDGWRGDWGLSPDGRWLHFTPTATDWAPTKGFSQATTELYHLGGPSGLERVKLPGMLEGLRVRELAAGTARGTLILDGTVPHGLRPRTLTELEAALRTAPARDTRENCWTSLTVDLRDPERPVPGPPDVVRCWGQDEESTGPGFPGR
jgi:hypothetical protein